MALHWDLTRINDREVVCFQQTKEGKQMKALTHTLIMISMHVGFTEITSENYERWWYRFTFVDMALGPFLHKDNGPYVVTIEDVKAHIGLRVNVSNQGEAAWKANMKRILFERRHEEVLRRKAEVQGGDTAKVAKV
jgi:hypothetical protein